MGERDTRRAAERARACFAVAASTTHAGEKAAAIDRGMALLDKFGLDPDRFEIPGRVRQVKPGGERFGKWADKWDDTEANPNVGSRAHKGDTSTDWIRNALNSADFEDFVRMAVMQAMERRRANARAGAVNAGNCKHGLAMNGAFCAKCAQDHLARASDAPPPERYWTGPDGNLWCTHGPILHGVSCVFCERGE